LPVDSGLFERTTALHAAATPCGTPIAASFLSPSLEPERGANKNSLLASLPEPEFEALASGLQYVSLPR